MTSLENCMNPLDMFNQCSVVCLKFQWMCFRMFAWMGFACLCGGRRFCNRRQLTLLLTGEKLREVQSWQSPGSCGGFYRSAVELGRPAADHRSYTAVNLLWGCERIRLGLLIVDHSRLSALRPHTLVHDHTAATTHTGPGATKSHK